MPRDSWNESTKAQMEKPPTRGHGSGVITIACFCVNSEFIDHQVNNIKHWKYRHNIHSFQSQPDLQMHARQCSEGICISSLVGSRPSYLLSLYRGLSLVFCRVNTTFPTQHTTDKVRPESCTLAYSTQCLVCPTGLTSERRRGMSRSTVIAANCTLLDTITISFLR